MPIASGFERPLPVTWLVRQPLLPRRPSPSAFSPSEHPGDTGPVCSPLRAVFIPLPSAPRRRRCRVRGSLNATEMSSSSGFNDEKGGSSSVGEPEYGHDPASGGIFSSDYKRYGATLLRGGKAGWQITGGLRVLMFFLLLLMEKMRMIHDRGAVRTELCLLLGRDWERCPFSGGDFCLAPWFNRVSVPKWRPSFGGKQEYVCAITGWSEASKVRGVYTAVFVRWNGEKARQRGWQASAPGSGGFSAPPLLDSAPSRSSAHRKCWDASLRLQCS